MNNIEIIIALAFDDASMESVNNARSQTRVGPTYKIKRITTLLTFFYLNIYEMLQFSIY